MRQRKRLPKLCFLHGGTLTTPKDKRILYKLLREARFWAACIGTKRIRSGPLKSSLCVMGRVLGGSLGGLQTTDLGKPRPTLSLSPPNIQRGKPGRGS